MAESMQHKITRNRKPRVHITYDVETEGATVKKELPFVVGVLGDFSATPQRTSSRRCVIASSSRSIGITSTKCLPA
jgi:type VI secretion system ImpB/VipA family protein